MDISKAETTGTETLVPSQHAGSNKAQVSHHEQKDQPNALHTGEIEEQRRHRTVVHEVPREVVDAKASKLGDALQLGGYSKVVGDHRLWEWGLDAALDDLMDIVNEQDVVPLEMAYKIQDESVLVYMVFETISDAVRFKLATP